ncbi:unnamed protein product [Cylindrotheca closterium]|uniref:RING-type domain-containing protein n=1 Tax=Cylindrotheca closterium TaxID=2856 RepID=A0AAD2CQP5_9STRA|nr:unnamed protein product [Cylindrotheca closterium]
MVVPYLRRPSHRNNNQPIAIQTKSQYHLEPDHATTYKHVGRRTKGGGGGGYLYSSSASSNSNSSGGLSEETEAIIAWSFLGIFGFVILCMICVSIYGCCVGFYRGYTEDTHRPQQRQGNDRSSQQQERDANDIQDREVQQYFSSYRSEDATVDAILAKIDRKRLISSKLQYQYVLPDNKRNKTDDEDITEVSNDDDGGSVIAFNETKKPSAKSSSTSSFFLPVRNLFSARSSRINNKKRVCSICLDGFHPGHCLCISANASCNHVFHEQCMESWLMDHDHCPNCRCNIMK